MLVAVSGAQGCGKSTILDELKRLGHNVIERKTSRSILAEWGMSLDDINNDVEWSIRFQNEILARKLEDEQLAVESADLWFTERTTADLFVYALINLGKHNSCNEWIDQYYEQCRIAQSRYHKVFYVRSGLFEVVNDGVRAAGGHYSSMVDMLMDEYTKRTVGAGKLTSIIQPGVTERVNFILSNI